MKNYVDLKKEDCCGCGACVMACESGGLSMLLDEEGFRYPHVNQDICTQCGYCAAKCHMANPSLRLNNAQPDCYAAYNRDRGKIIAGSSGGIFESLCETMYDMQGIVYGAALDSGFQVKHYRAVNLEEAKRFRKAKYLQSDMGDMYLLAEKDLQAGRTVLFSGTPCQIAGLYGYLGKTYPNLYTMDLLCQGIPSERLFFMYLAALQEKYQSKPLSICWRDKRDGWKPNKVSIVFESGKEICSPSLCNSMQRMFLKSICLRPSCYQCKYASLPRIGDISLGEFWRYNGKLLKNNHNAGIGLIVVSNKKGRTLFDKAGKNLIFEKMDLEYCKEKVDHLNIGPKFSEERESFMSDIKQGMNFESLIQKHIFSKSYSEEIDFFSIKDFLKFL